MIKDIEQQIKEFDEMIKKYPDVKDFYLGRAELYGKIKQYKKACEDYKKARNHYILNDITSICERYNLIEEAEMIYTKAINKDKNNSENYMRRASFYALTGKNKKAITDCKTVLKLQPQNKIILDMAEMLIKKLNGTN